MEVYFWFKKRATIPLAPCMSFLYAVRIYHCDKIHFVRCYTFKKQGCNIEHIKTVLRIRIRDPGLGIFLTPGSGIRDQRKSASGSGIRDEQAGSYFLELRNHFFCFFGFKILKFFDEDLGSGIRDGKKSDPG